MRDRVEFRRCDGSANTIPASAARSSDPSALTICEPNSSTSAASLGFQGDDFTCNSVRINDERAMFGKQPSDSRLTGANAPVSPTRRFDTTFPVGGPRWLLVAASELVAKCLKRLVRVAAQRSFGLVGRFSLSSHPQEPRLPLQQLRRRPSWPRRSGSVLFPAGESVVVLALPLGTLILEAFLPLTGVGVKPSGRCRRQPRRSLRAFRRGRDRTHRPRRCQIVRLLERQRDPTTLEVDIDDLHEDFVINRDDLLRHLNVTLCELGNVDGPSMPSSTRTNAPNGTSLVTRPGTT